MLTVVYPRVGKGGHRVRSYDSRRSEEFLEGWAGGGNGEMEDGLGKNLPRKAFDSCKPFVYIWLLGVSTHIPIGAPPLDRAETPQRGLCVKSRYA